MTIRRILVMHSIEDELSRQRMNALSRLTEYEVWHFFIKQESGKDVHKMVRALEGRIESVNPDLVWVHHGLLARFMGEPFLEVIDELQRKFGGVLFVRDDENLRPEYRAKYPMRSIWDDPYGELHRLIVAAKFGIFLEEGETGSFGFIEQDGDSI
jgi:hypothetical protein